jgi:CDGSH-type Zn-finger protein
MCLFDRSLNNIEIDTDGKVLMLIMYWLCRCGEAEQNEEITGDSVQSQ